MGNDQGKTIPDTTRVFAAGFTGAKAFLHRGTFTQQILNGPHYKPGGYSNGANSRPILSMRSKEGLDRSVRAEQSLRNPSIQDSSCPITSAS